MNRYEIVEHGTWEDRSSVNLCVKRFDPAIEMWMTLRIGNFNSFGWLPWMQPKEVDFDSAGFGNITVHAPTAVQFALYIVEGEEIDPNHMHYVLFMRDGILR